jgi:transposase InsO family protein
MARSTFYYYLNRFKAADKYADLKVQIQAIYHKHKGRYGYRRITLTLRQLGYIINHKTVLRLMKGCGLKCLVRIKKYRSYRGQQGKIAPNLLQRNFEAKRPFQKWVTDVTEFSFKGQKLYLSPIMDLFNGEVVSYSLSERSTIEHTIEMLKKALVKLPGHTNLILHSDQGWQYQTKAYQRILIQKNIKQSMSRKGNCLDNAVIENFFGTLKSELFYINTFRNIEHLKDEIEKYIKYYNNERIKLKLKGMSPVQYRTHAA